MGKSTLFNALTSQHQHTGNWPGKTVAMARGCCATECSCYELADLPGTYSLRPHSPEEEVARAFLTDCHPDAAVVVCDTTCLERNLNLALQVMKLCPKTLICVNLLDKARRKGITVNLKLLAHRLEVPVIGTSARDNTSPLRLLMALNDLLKSRSLYSPRPVPYPTRLEQPP